MIDEWEKAEGEEMILEACKGILESMVINFEEDIKDLKKFMGKDALKRINALAVKHGLTPKTIADLLLLSYTLKDLEGYACIGNKRQIHKHLENLHVDNELIHLVDWDKRLKFLLEEKRAIQFDDIYIIFKD